MIADIFNDESAESRLRSCENASLKLCTSFWSPLDQVLSLLVCKARRSIAPWVKLLYRQIVLHFFFALSFVLIHLLLRLVRYEQGKCQNCCRSSVH